jgi:phosphatidylglycerophosphate synthase
MVALAAKTASLRGELLNDLPDRVSDVLIFVGAGHSGLCHVLGGYWAAIFALLVAYVGMFGQALGVQREFSGVMSKPWRMVSLSVGAVVTAIITWLHEEAVEWRGLTVLDGTFLLIVAGCLQTIRVRIARIMLSLRRRHEQD